MNVFSLPPLFSSISVLSLGIYSFLKNKNSEPNKKFFLLSLAGFWWQFSWFILFNIQQNELLASILAKIGYSGIIFIPPSYFDFVTSLTNFERTKNRRLLLRINYFISFLLFFILWFTDYFISGVNRYEWGFYPKSGSLHWIHLLQLFLFVGIGFASLIKKIKYKNNDSLKVLQIKYVIIAFIIYSFAASDYIVNYGVNFYPFGFVFQIVSYFIFAYAIIKYRLMDISIIVKKTSLLTISIIFPMSSYALLINFLQPTLMPILGPSQWWMLVGIFAFLLVFMIYKIVVYIAKLREEEIEKERYKYRTILKKYIEDITKSRGFKEAATYIVRRITSIGRIKFCALARLKEDLEEGKIKTYYKIVKVANRTGRQLKYLENLTLEETMLFIAHIKNTREYIEKNYLKHILDTQRQINHWYYNSIIKEMEMLNAELIFPAFDSDILYGLLILGDKIEGHYTQEDIELFKLLTLQATKSIKEIVEREEKIRLILASCNATLQALDGKDHYTRGHTERVKIYCKILAKNPQICYEINKVSEGVWGLELAAELHDIGKISIPDTILNKKEKLSIEEYEKIKKHPLEAIRILEPLKIWLKENIINGIVQHHENYDGSGYPFGLKAKEIHIYSRIIRIADAIDAMSTERPYRKPLTKEEIIAELRRYRGKWFDPFITDILIEEIFYKPNLLPFFPINIENEIFKEYEQNQEFMASN